MQVPHRPGILAVLMLAMMVEPSCWFRKKAKVTPPVIAAPPSTRTPPPENPKVPPPPKVTPQTAEVTPEAPPIETPVPDPPKPEQPPRPVRRANTQPKPSPSAPSVEAPEPERPAVPQLTQLMSPEEQAVHNRAIDRSIVQAREHLGQVDQRRLNASQRSTFERAQAFIGQAEQTRATDLATAKALAERAVILAEDLARTTR
jgi:hypothetical protein